MVNVRAEDRSRKEAAEGSVAGYPRQLNGSAKGGFAEELGLGELLRAVRRHMSLLTALTGLVTLAGTLIVFQIPPLYASDAYILVGTQRTNVVNIEDVLGGFRDDVAAVRSEVEVLTSRSLANKVVDALGLMERPEFNASLRAPSLLSRVNPLSWGSPDQALSAEDTRTQVVRAFRSHIEVEMRPRSRVLTVTATSQDRQLAAAMANTLADEYLEDQLDAKFKATRQAADWLHDRVADMRQQVEASERAVEAYRREHGLVESKDTTIAEQQITEVNTQLILAATQSAAAAAELRQAEALANSAQGVESASDVLTSPLIQALRQREADVASRIAEMATELGPLHPKMINAHAEVQDTREKIEAEVDRIVQGMRNDLEVARTREQTLRASLNRLETERAEVNTAQGTLEVLEREAVANKALFDTLLARWNEIGQNDGLQHADARIISRANVPASPASPNTPLAIGGSFFVGLLLAVLLAVTIESVRRGMQSSEDVDALLGVSTLSLVPLLKRSRLKKGVTPEQYVLDKPASSFAEAHRSLLTGLLISGAESGPRPRSILVTSALPEEGKTTISLATARLAAKGGQRVLLVDADMRTNRIARLMGLTEQVGLGDVLADGIDLAATVQRDSESSLDVLVAGRRRPNPTDLITSTAMQELLASLERQYDWVILDSPPVLAVSDARYLSRLSGTTVFVVKWMNTRGEVAQLAFRQLVEAGANIPGVVLSMVDARKNARYGYADSGYYYYGYGRYGYGRKYRQYYVE